MGMAHGLTIAAALLALPGTMAAQTRPQPRPVTPDERDAARGALAAFARPTLTRFNSEAEFRRYVEAVRQVERTRYDYYYDYSALAGLQYAQATPPAPGTPVQSDAPPETCVPTPTNPCTDDVTNDLPVTVTGSRINARNPSITNNQMRGVEEGDIVKQIDHYLLVLQDGRIFVIDMQAGAANPRTPGRRLALTDRVNVYRNPRSGIWYDEMLVFGDRVLITGYSYDDRATELAVFRLGAGGRLAREGVFRISSNDYYSDNNYSTRLIDGNLVTYTPLRVRDMTHAGYKWPVVRRWLPEDDAREIADGAAERRGPGEVGGPPLLDAAQIYRPVANVDDPVIHTVSVCPLASTARGGALRCRTTAFAGPARPEWVVTNANVFLWTSRDNYWSRGRQDCRSGAPAALADFAPAYLYRVPVSGARPDVIAARGFPPDQFAMQSDGTSFHALVRMERADCEEPYNAQPRLSFVSIPLARLGRTLAEAPASSFTTLPSTSGRWVASRFTDRYLVYGGLSRHRRGYPDLSASWYDDESRHRILEEMRPRPAYVVPIARPSAVRALDIGHTVIRAERVADDIVLTGYRDTGGLIVSLIDLDGPARVASSVRLEGRYESEGRSHAFNSLIEADGSGLMGLPTVPLIADSDRDYWRTKASDLSFLSLDRTGRLASIGALERRFDYVDDYDSETEARDDDGVPGYECEVSCVDWYGNSRPIFTDGRVFALSGTELIEGRVERGRISEVQRLNIALSPPL